MRSGIAAVAYALCIALSMQGCSTSQLGYAPDGTIDGSLPGARKMLDLAQTHFVEGQYGKAAETYAKTVEVDPQNAEAWLGLAASYDQIRRFDQADAAYAKVQELTGATPNVLNNLGYSYLLRGNLERSRVTLAAAQQGDPYNPYILNNIDMLNARLAETGKPPVAPR